MPAQPGFKGDTKLDAVTKPSFTVDGFTIPADLLPGDVLIYTGFGQNTSGGAPAADVPSGFTTIVSQALSNYRFCSTCRLLQEGDPGTVIPVLVSGTGGSLHNLYAFRGSNRLIRAVSLHSLLSQFTDGNPNSQVISASGVSGPAVAHAWYVTSFGDRVSPTVMTPEGDEEVDPDGTLNWKIKYYSRLTAPQDHTVDMNDEGSRNGLFSWYMKFS